MKVLELFSGTASFSKAAKLRGYETFTVEIDKSFNPDLCIDIMDLTKKDIPWIPDIIWASPPCQCFSVASVSHHWTDWETPKTEKAIQALKLIKHTVKLINSLDPKYYFIENPRAMLRKQDLMYALPRHTVTYCQYGDTRMKPTDIWTNLPDWNSKKCKNGDSCHVSAPRGSRQGTQGIQGAKNRSIVPQGLCNEILDVIEAKKYEG